MIDVEVVYCPQPGVVDCVALSLPDGSTLRVALDASGLLARHGLSPASATVRRTGPRPTTFTSQTRFDAESGTAQGMGSISSWKRA